MTERNDEDTTSLAPEGTVKQAARKSIDERVQQLRKKIRELQGRRNALSPIALVPPQVLATIFVLLRDSCEQSVGYGYRFHLSWLRVARVCSQWREIALGCPELWTIIYLDHPDLAIYMLRNAKVAPLTIVHKVRNEKILTRLQEIVPHLSHTKLFDLGWDRVTYSDGFHQALLVALASPTPLLECFRLKLTESPTNSAALSDDIFLDAPLLREVELSRVGLQWGPTLFQNTHLSSLKLEFTRSPSLSQLIEVLQKTPELQTLSLVDSLPKTRTTVGTKDEFLGSVIHLRFLESLVLRDEADSAVQFLSRIRHPPTSRLDLHFISSQWSQESFCSKALVVVSQDLRTSRDNFPDMNISSVQSVLLAGGFNCPSKFSIFDRSLDIPTRADWRYTRNPTKPLVNMVFSGTGTNGLHHLSRRLVQEFFSVFDLSQVTDLEFDHKFDYPTPHILRTICGLLPKIDIICVSRCIPYELRQSLEDKKTFRALKTIAIEDGEFGYTRYPEHTKDLIALLKNRQALRMPIKSLILNTPNRLKDKRLMMFSGLVEDVRVNGDPLDVSKLDLDGKDYRTDYFTDDEDDEENINSDVSYSW